MVADHLTEFPEPRMRRAIMAHGRMGGEGLDPTAAQAIAMLTENASEP